MSADSTYDAVALVVALREFEESLDSLDDRWKAVKSSPVVAAGVAADLWAASVDLSLTAELMGLLAERVALLSAVEHRLVTSDGRREFEVRSLFDGGKFLFETTPAGQRPRPTIWLAP
jgi:hypothetical protein